MKHPSAIFILILLLFSGKVFSQKARETSVGIGFNKTITESFRNHWSNEFSTPTFLNIKVNKNWYRANHVVGFVKSVGINLQYSNINIAGGGLGAGNHFTGKIVNLSAEASLQARIRFDSIISVSIGPAVEYLVGGYHNINNSYYSALTNPPRSGDIRDSGVGRDYFNKPSYGIKLGIAPEKANIGLNLYYYWTKSGYSNLFTSNYLQISITLIFRKLKPINSQETTY